MSVSDGGTRRLAIIGDGKMGRAVAELAPAAGWTVTAMLGLTENADARGITRASLGGADVAVEFTEPAAAVANARACIAAGCPVVIGTTGWYDQLPTLRDEATAAGGTLFWAANFSLGVNTFIELAREAGRRFAAIPGFDTHIIESHHAAKKDAPSGTAVVLERAIAGTLGRSVPTTSVRTGFIPGTHEVVFDGAFEQIRLTHMARDRRVFAEGALVAARWLIGRRGVFTMQDLMHDLMHDPSPALSRPAPEHHA